ncbi:MAG: PA0069 family radical SAM protein [Pirellulales bacterium]
MTTYGRPSPRGRGSHINPPNRFERTHSEADYEHFECDPSELEQLDRPRTEYLPDDSQSVVTENDSPDVPLRYSLNPYRGCSHGCSYCFARPTHEYLGFSAGLDFETKVLVKHKAPLLFREFLSRPAWRPEPIMLSGVTDCYQPAERELKLTRQCLEVALEARQPIGIITKNALVLRDLDLLSQMATLEIVQVNLSVTTLDASLGRTMEPRTSAPAARLRAIRELSSAGVPVRALLAPIIPGLNDSEIPAILQAVREAGAGAAGYVLLRLPLTVEPVFREWLARTQPNKCEHVESLIRQTRGGKMNESQWRVRMVGTGPLAEQIGSLFKVFSARYQLDQGLGDLDCSKFRCPPAASGQLRLFG